MELDFEKLFRISNTALYVIKLHPHVKRDKKWLIQTILLQVFISTILLMVLYNIWDDVRTNDFSRTCRDGVVMVVNCVVTVQYLAFIFNRDSLLKLINHMNKDYEICKTWSSDEQEIVRKYALNGANVCMQWLVLTAVIFLGFILKSVFLYIYNYIIGDFELVPFYEFNYPDVISEKKDNFLMYIFLYSCFTLYSFYALNMYTAYCPLGPIFMLHACGQLDVVIGRLENVFVEIDNDVIKAKLKQIIMQLQDIFYMVEIIKDIFKVPYEFTLKTTTIILPITFYEVIEAAKRGELSVEFISFIVGGILISSSPCYYSDLLKEKGELVRDSIYACGWERYYNGSARSTLNILSASALQPLAIKSVFKILCLETLADVFQQAYTIFNLMNAMWE